jgi:hypothetical protein
LFEIENHEVGEFYISMVLRNRTSNYRWEMIMVYGQTHNDRSRDFIAEMSRKCMVATLPLIMGGDFNLIRHMNDKNNDNVNQELMDRFNMFINLHQLQEIRRNGPKFTWTNKQKKSVMVKLDRILASTEWEAKFPMCFAWSKARVGSDHCPIFLDSGEGSMSKQKYFYFEKQWLLDEEFSDIFLKNWRASGEKTKNWKNSADIWHECLCRSR